MRKFIFYEPLDNISAGISMPVLGSALMGTLNGALHNVHITIFGMKIGKVIRLAKFEIE